MKPAAKCIACGADLKSYSSTSDLCEDCLPIPRLARRGDTYKPQARWDNGQARGRREQERGRRHAQG
jgi:hypothetical protein